MKLRKRLRLKEFDYSTAGYYFVTICTKDKKHWFGRVENEDMKLSSIGKIAKECWKEIPQHFKNVELGVYIIMPNHIHGILVVRSGIVRDAHVRPVRDKMLISKAIHGFKSSTTRIVRKEINKTFSWHRSFYDRVIRSEHELNNIRRYMTNNVLKWEMDIENKRNVTDKLRKNYYEDIYK